LQVLISSIGQLVVGFVCDLEQGGVAGVGKRGKTKVRENGVWETKPTEKMPSELVDKQ